MPLPATFLAVSPAHEEVEVIPVEHYLEATLALAAQLCEAAEREEHWRRRAARWKDCFMLAPVGFAFLIFAKWWVR